MEIEEYLAYLREGKKVEGGSDLHMIMHTLSQEALKITSELNGSYHTPQEIRRLMECLTGRPVDESFRMFPPFYTDCGKNIYFGKNVFVNCNCHFQDQGGIYIGDGSLIGSFVMFATINHGKEPSERSDNLPASIHVGKNVWIGSHATILPGVTVGDNSIVAAGAVVSRDVPADTIVGGVPAKVIKSIYED